MAKLIPFSRQPLTGRIRPRRRYPWRAILGALPIVFLVAMYAVEIVGSFQRSRSMTIGEAFRHIAARPNCDAARAVNLAPAKRGEPGYWPSHDADDDRVACEPWP